VFGSSREDWSPDQPDAFAEPLIVIPWVQILEALPVARGDHRQADFERRS
jgi:hypothetical protein